ncbi:MAG: hypothetical protein HPY85_08290 [Anaerolineae bacterium]|nr:hypothetical protein [Anaerolineae bacterium]
MSQFIYAPMINVNEDTATLIEWRKAEGELVNKGELLCVLETTKSTFDLTTEFGGYLVPLTPAGAQVETGQIIAVLTTSPGESYTLPEAISNEPNQKTVVEPRTNWTKKAEILANKNKLSMEDMAQYFGKEERITEQDILTYLAHTEPVKENHPVSKNVNKSQRILIIGGGNIAVLVLDILARVPNQTAMGIVDDNPGLSGTNVCGCPILGNLQEVPGLWKAGAFDLAALAVGALPARAELFERFSRQGIPFANIIDPTAVIGINSMMGNGNMIMAHCRIGPESQIGDNNFLSAYVNIEHHNVMGDHCTFGPNVAMSGGVHIGSHVRFGTGISIEPRLTIGDHVVIASGVILTTHVPPGTIVRNKANFAFHKPAE